MGLKQDIVIVNEYSVPLPKTGGSSRGHKFKGSRGGSPGEYVLRYMARDGATEQVAPIRRHEVSDFVERYMARESATESLEVESIPDLKRRMKRGQGEGGVAFGNGSFSYSHERLTQESARLQQLFDAGHTFMKTVISFDQDYLKKHGLIPEDFALKRKGDYRGHLDQMKLRMAISQGMDRLGQAHYDDLRWVGVIQVDTEHVHCHLTMIDAGSGTVMPDGTQKGKIPQAGMSLMRRGIDAFLDEKQHVKHLSSAVGYERRNVASYVKRWAHQQMLAESLPQLLLATLPEDRRLWRSSSNDPTMRKPNRVVRELVEEVLAEPDSPMPAAMAKVHDYADRRRAEEQLTRRQWQQLVERGRGEIIERGVNGVYAMLRQLPADALRVRTPMLEVMGMDYEEIAARAHDASRTRPASAEEDLVAFSFRLRSYSNRLEHHIGQREQHHRSVRTWEQENAAGRTAATSRVLYAFFQEEEEYHAMVAAKYRHLLNFLPAQPQWQAEWERVSHAGEQMLSLQSMRRDDSLRKLGSPAEAEQRGREIYGQAGGHLVALNTAESLAVLDRRIVERRQVYDRRLDELRMRFSAQGLRVQVVGDETVPGREPGRRRPVADIRPGAEYDFEDVKTLDLHHMRFDFAQDVEVGSRGRSRFITRARLRAEQLQEAVTYLETSNQHDAVRFLPITDIERMNKLADTFETGSQHLPSEVAQLVRSQAIARRSATVRLGQGLQHQVTGAVGAQLRGFDPTQTLLEQMNAEREQEPGGRESGSTPERH